MFDTNALFTDNEYFLLNHDVSELIRANSRHLDVTLSWHLPEIVKMERQYQMEKRGLELLPSIKKVERLLGHNLNITEEILRLRLREAIQKQIDDLNLHIVTLNHGAVGWQEVVENAAFRRPPFAVGTEKGFRDALVLESFVQLVDASPSSRSVCRIALVSGDKLLRDAAEERLKESTNIRILPTLEDLRNLINTLVSEISEETVGELREIAAKLFYNFDKNEGFCKTSGALDRVRSLVSAAVAQPPESAAGVQIGDLHLMSPSFQGKEGSTITWSSRFENEIQAYAYRMPAMSNTAISSGGGLGPNVNALTNPGYPSNLQTTMYPTNLLIGSTYPTNVPLNIGTEYLGGSPGLAYQPTLLGGYDRVPIRSGSIVIDVVWATKVTHRRTLKEPSLLDVTVVETKWV
jgi:hypothetical protein